MESETTTTTTTKKEKPSGNPPAKPESNSNSNSNSDSSSSSNSSNTPPEMPEEMDGEMPEMPQCDEDDEDCEMPEPPSGTDGNPPGMPGEMTTIGTNDNTWHPAIYLSIGAGSVILSATIMYACFSNFFRKKPTEVFSKWQTIAILCGATIVLAAGICALCYFIPEWTS